MNKKVLIKFYKLRAILFILIAKVIAKVFFVEMPPVVSVATFIKKDEKILFLNLTYMKGLGLPGGIIKADEDTGTALRREVKEETGLTVTKLEYLWSVSAYKKISMLCLFFNVEVEGNLKDSEEGDLVWLNPKEAIGKMVYENVEISLRKFLELQ